MKNEDRILQILTDMQQDMTEVKQDIAGLKQHMTTFEDRLDEQKSIILNLENNFEKRLDALTDGYVLNKEKHEILERRVDTVEVRIGRLEIAAS